MTSQQCFKPSASPVFKTRHPRRAFVNDIHHHDEIDVVVAFVSLSNFNLHRRRTKGRCLSTVAYSPLQGVPLIHE
jgi:hypothetical protein